MRKLQQHWDDLAKIDPMTSICTDPQKDGRKWLADEFFQSGVREIQTVLTYVQSLGLSPDRKSPALDFGCGVGRLTAALSHHFDECWGVDISPTMVRLAKEFHGSNARCNFLLNESGGLASISSDTFGFIYSSIVLQHMKAKYVQGYLLEFLRVLKPGGIMVFQTADRDLSPFFRRVRQFVGLRRRWNRLLRRREPAALRMEMHCIQENKIRKLLSGRNVRIVDVRLTNSTARDFNGNLQFLHEEPQQGYVSKQYCIVKNGKGEDAGRV